MYHEMTDIEIHLPTYETIIDIQFELLSPHIGNTVSMMSYNAMPA